MPETMAPRSTHYTDHAELKDFYFLLITGQVTTLSKKTVLGQSEKMFLNFFQELQFPSSHRKNSPDHTSP